VWYVYILQCADDSLYTGITNDVAARFAAHLSGKGAKYTRSHRPIKVVFEEAFATQSEALKREIEIKRWPRRKKLTLLKFTL
jgi:putative endonuclease